MLKALCLMNLNDGDERYGDIVASQSRGRIIAVSDESGNTSHRPESAESKRDRPSAVGSPLPFGGQDEVASGSSQTVTCAILQKTFSDGCLAAATSVTLTASTSFRGGQFECLL